MVVRVDIAAGSSRSPILGKQPLPRGISFKIACVFVATLIGFVFSVVLVMVQMGLHLGFGRRVTAIIDHAPHGSVDRGEWNEKL